MDTGFVGVAGEGVPKRGNGPAAAADHRAHPQVTDASENRWRVELTPAPERMETRGTRAKDACPPGRTTH